jgi:Phosphotransferase enzyme family
MIDLDEAATWIDEGLAAAGAARTGTVERVRERPWGEVVKAETDRGVVWLKEPRGATAFEVRLYEVLADRVPEHVLVPLAIDAVRGWVLLPEGGAPLGETAEGEDLVAGLTVALRSYGRLQRKLAGDAERLLELGVADMRPAAMPGRFDEALAAGQRYVDELGGPADRASLDRLQDERARFIAMCEDLAGRPGAASLDHNDLHPWNILGPSSDAGNVRFYDWGDSVVAHPFAAMLVPLGFAGRVSPAHVIRARDAYLAEFADVADHGELVATLELACRVAKVARALVWERALLAGAAADFESDDFARAPLESLEGLLDEEYLGRT